MTFLTAVGMLVWPLVMMIVVVLLAFTALGLLNMIIEGPKNCSEV